MLLVAIVALFAATGGSLIDLLGRTPPPADEFDVRGVEFKPGEITVRVTNPQQEDLTIATVTVDDAIVPFSSTARRRSTGCARATIVIPYDWVEDEPIADRRHELDRDRDDARDRRRRSRRRSRRRKGFLGFALIGLLVGVVPVALGLLWLPSLRRARPRVARRVHGADRRAADVPRARGAVRGVRAPGRAAVGARRRRARAARLRRLLPDADVSSVATKLAARAALATLVAIGIGLHNFGEGLAIGTSFAFGELALGTFLIVGFMIHNVTEGLGIATAATEERRVSIGAARAARR